MSTSKYTIGIDLLLVCPHRVLFMKIERDAEKERTHRSSVEHRRTSTSVSKNFTDLLVIKVNVLRVYVTMQALWMAYGPS